MVSHCDTCNCEPETICFGIHRKLLLTLLRFLTGLVFMGIATVVSEFIARHGFDSWDTYRFNLLIMHMLALSVCFTMLILLHTMPYWGIIWSCMLGIWYVTEDFVTNPPLFRFRDRFFGQRVNPEARASGPVNDSTNGNEPPPLPPKRKIVLRGEDPRPLPNIRIDRRPTSLTTPRDRQESETFGILSPTEPVTSPPVPKPQTKRQTKKDRFKKKMNDIVSLKPIEEYEEIDLQASASHIEIPLSRLLSKPSFSGETSEDASFSSVTDYSEIGRKSRISKYRDARKISKTDEQISAEECLPLFGAHESLQTSVKIVEKQKTAVQEQTPSEEIPRTKASEKYIEMKKQMKSKETSRSYVPISTLEKTQIKAKNVEKSKDAKRASSQGQTSTETLRHDSGSQIKGGEIKQRINEQKTSARHYVPVSTLEKPTSELHAVAKFERGPRRDTEQPEKRGYVISDILLNLQSTSDPTPIQKKMPSETLVKESKNVQPSLSNVLDDQNTQSLAEGLPHPSSVSRDSSREVPVSNRPNQLLSGGFAIAAEEEVTAAGSITNSQVFEYKLYDQPEEFIDLSHIDVTVRFEKQKKETKYKKAVGEIQIKASGDQPALKQRYEVKRLESREQTSTRISRGSYVRRKEGEDFSLTGVSRGTDAPRKTDQSMSRLSKDASSLPLKEEAASQAISASGRPSLHLSSGIVIVRDEAEEGTESPEIQDIFDQPRNDLDLRHIDSFNPATDGRKFTKDD